MAGDVAETTFQDLISRGILCIGDGYRAKLEELGGDGPIFLRAGLVSDTHIAFDGAERFHRHLAAKLLSKMSQPGDVVITTKGNSTGRVAYVDESMPSFVYSPHLSYWRAMDASVLSAGYLRYWSRSEDFQSQLRGLSRSTDMAPYLSLVDQRRLKITLPMVEEQRAIAHILGTLDDKIELNRRMNETLEAIARAMFQSWFIDFDPVRAKASGEPPESICRRLGLTPELLALFPDRLVDSELGEIPEGWAYSTLAAQAKRCGGVIQTGPFGSQLHAADYLSEGVPVVMPQDILNRRVSVARIARVSIEIATRLSRHALAPGDVVYSRRGDIERHALISERESGWLCGTGCLLVRLGPSWPSQAYLSEALDQSSTRRWLVQHAVGATMPNLNTAILGAVPLLLPPDILLRGFETFVGGFRKWSVSSSAQSDILGQIRDSLLPKLISGDLRVPLEDAACASP